MAGIIQAPVLQGGRDTMTPSSVVMFWPHGAVKITIHLSVAKIEMNKQLAITVTLENRQSLTPFLTHAQKKQNNQRTSQKWVVDKN